MSASKAGVSGFVELPGKKSGGCYYCTAVPWFEFDCDPAVNFKAAKLGG